MFDKPYNFQHFWDIVTLAYVEAKDNKDKPNEQIKKEIYETARLLWILRNTTDEPPVPDRCKPAGFQTPPQVDETTQRLQAQLLDSTGFGGKDVPGDAWGGVGGEAVHGKMGGPKG